MISYAIDLYCENKWNQPQIVLQIATEGKATTFSHKKIQYDKQRLLDEIEKMCKKNIILRKCIDAKRAT